MANVNHMAKLDEGIAAWNHWRDECPHIRPDLTAADLSGRDLQDANLSHCLLNDAILIDAQLDDVDLSHAEAQRANLQAVIAPNLHIEGALLVEATLTDMYAPNATLTDVNMRKVTAYNLQLPGATIGFSSFQGAELEQVDISKATVRHSNFDYGKLQHVNFQRTVIERCSFYRATVKHGDLRYALQIHNDYHKATLHDLRLYGSSTWEPMLDDASQSLLNFASDDCAPSYATDLHAASFFQILSTSDRLVTSVNQCKLIVCLGAWPESRLFIPEVVLTLLNQQGFLVVALNLNLHGMTPKILHRYTTLAKQVIVDLSRVTPALTEALDHMHQINVVYEAIAEVGREDAAETLRNPEVEESRLFRDDTDLQRMIPSLIRNLFSSNTLATQ